MKVIRYLPIWTSSPLSSCHALDAVAVDERAVQRALVLDGELPVRLDQDRVVPRHGDVVEEDLAVGRAPDPRARPDGPERLPRPAAAGAHHERRALPAPQTGRRDRRPRRAKAPGSSRSSPARPSRSAPRSARSSSTPQDSESRTPGSTRSSRRRGGLPGEDLRQPIDVHLVENALPTRALRSRTTSSPRRMSIFPCSRRRR